MVAWSHSEKGHTRKVTGKGGKGRSTKPRKKGVRSAEALERRKGRKVWAADKGLPGSRRLDQTPAEPEGPPPWKRQCVPGTPPEAFDVNYVKPPQTPPEGRTIEGTSPGTPEEAFKDQGLEQPKTPSIVLTPEEEPSSDSSLLSVVPRDRAEPKARSRSRSRSSCSSAPREGEESVPSAPTVPVRREARVAAILAAGAAEARAKAKARAAGTAIYRRRNRGLVIVPEPAVQPAAAVPTIAALEAAPKAEPKSKGKQKGKGRGLGVWTAAEEDRRVREGWTHKASLDTRLQHLALRQYWAGIDAGKPETRKGGAPLTPTTNYQIRRLAFGWITKVTAGSVGLSLQRALAGRAASGTAGGACSSCDERELRARRAAVAFTTRVEAKAKPNFVYRRPSGQLRSSSEEEGSEECEGEAE